jgi:hypothetical protein
MTKTNKWFGARGLSNAKHPFKEASTLQQTPWSHQYETPPLVYCHHYNNNAQLLLPPSHFLVIIVLVLV